MMKYYKLESMLWGDDRKVYPLATGTTVIDNHLFEDEAGITRDNGLDDSPLLDYFSLMNISKPGSYDWILLDVYEFSGSNSPRINGFLISEKAKDIFNKFKIQPPFHFYESKLLYQGEKYTYYVFQLLSSYTSNLKFPKTKWQYSPFHRLEELKDFDRIIYSAEEYNEGNGLMEERKFKVFPKVAVFEKYYDLFFIHSVNRFAISERLKFAIEAAGLKGFSLTPIDHIEFQFEEKVSL